jgi:L-aminopeptidase/D-esterase-like protein
MVSELNGTITDVPGIQVGHTQDEEALSGCTVVLCPDGAVGGIDQRGGAPGTRETDLLRPVHLVQKINAVLLTGGSAYGLDAAAGVMRYLEERGSGFRVGSQVVPIVPAAVIYDLDLGKGSIRPDAEMGYRACQNAAGTPPAQGNAGAGMGATVGKILGLGQAMKSGLGSASLAIGAGVIVGALVVVNAFGDVVDPHTGRIIAGARSTQVGPLKVGGQPPFADTLDLMRGLVGRTILGLTSRSNTVIGVVATNARMDKEGANKIAQMAQNGVARTIRPAHTMLDGDVLFTMATGEKKADLNIVGAYAAEVVAQAVVNAVRHAAGIAGLPAARELATGQMA